MNKVLSNWRLILPEKTRAAKKIKKGFDKIMGGKATYMNVSAIGPAYLVGDTGKGGRATVTTDIQEISVVENGLISFRTKNNAYLLNPEERHVI
ncbi:hypothetical protein J6T21_02235 [Candidatus Saccharibacteria bacterium]|nr:hypothetical protein [Candidatus Saccharibacteria bacterium]